MPLKNTKWKIKRAPKNIQRTSDESQEKPKIPRVGHEDARVLYRRSMPRAFPVSLPELEDG
jgi:hypothetical protein